MDERIRTGREAAREAAAERVQDAMERWLYQIKRPALASSSFSRLETTFEKQVKGTALGRLRVKEFSTACVQDHIMQLAAEGYSESSLRKVRDICCGWADYWNSEHKSPVMISRKYISIPGAGTDSELNVLSDAEIQRLEAELTKL